MEKWNSVLHLKTKQEVMQSQPIHIRRGIFHGDSLSPLLFYIALTALTHELNYGTGREISHFLYINDLKLLGRNDDLETEMKIVKAISTDIYMNSGLEKCEKIYLKKGRVQSKIYIASTFENDIKDWTQEKHVHI
jgi:hypothetical protein